MSTTTKPSASVRTANGSATSLSARRVRHIKQASVRVRQDEMLDTLLEEVEAGNGGALVLNAEPENGRTALVNRVFQAAPAFRIIPVAAAEPERELPFVVLHALCVRMLDRVERLSDPHREALTAAFAPTGAGSPDLLQVGLAVLSLLRQAAEDEPLVCLIEDAQWLDRASAEALSFATRRLASESVAMVFTVRRPNDVGALAGIPGLQPTEIEAA